MTALSSTPTAVPDAVHTTLRIAYTPDSDDAFNFYAWEHGKVGMAGYDAVFDRDHIIALNRAALRGEYDVVSVSSAAYPLMTERYAILAVGNSIGRGYGPVLVSSGYATLRELRGKRVAVAGMPTTGGMLAAMFVREAELIEAPYDRIADMIVAGEADAGVMIHEELLFYPRKGLRKVADLGAIWCERTNLPLPVGLNVVKRELGRVVGRQIAGMCRQSLQWALHHYGEAFAFASRFGRGDCSQQHVSMFSNDDTLCLPADARVAIRVLFDRIAALGLGPRVDSYEVMYA